MENLAVDLVNIVLTIMLIIKRYFNNYSVYCEIANKIVSTSHRQT